MTTTVTNPLNVGGRVSGIPSCSKVAHATRDGKRFAYVLTPDGTVRCLVRDVNVPSFMQAKLRERYFEFEA